MQTKEEKRAYAKKYYLENKEKESKRKAKYYQVNKEKLVIYHKSYYDSNKNIRKQWIEKNKEKIALLHKKYYLENKERLSTLNKIYIDSHKESRRISHQKRRALKKQIGGTLSKGITDKLMKLQRGKCAVCKTSVKDKHHLDHIMPLSLGGSNTDDNIQILCPSCNLSKGAKHPQDFMNSRGFLL